MRRIILGVKLIVLAVWTALCLGVYALVNLVGDELIRHSDILPVSPEGVAFTSWLLALAQKLGFGLVIGVWALGVIVIVLVAWIARRLAPPPARPLSSRDAAGPRRDQEPVRRLPGPEA